MELFKGTVRSVIYHSDFYYILEFATQEAQAYAKGITMKGNLFGLPHACTGMPLTVMGEWTRSRKYGRQLQIRNWDVFPNNPAGIRVFLSCVPGFDVITADFVVDRYGLDTFKALGDPAKVLKEVEAANQKDLEASVAGWERVMTIRNLSDVLKGGGLTVSDIEAAVRKFGSDASAIIHANPFRLMEIPGFEFSRVDMLAISLGIPEDHPCRVEGATLWALSQAAKDGHLFLRRGDIPERIRSLGVASSPAKYKDALTALEDRKAIVVESGVGVYLAMYHEYERQSANKLATLMSPSTLSVDFDPFLVEFERSSSLELSKAQVQAVRQLIENKVLVLTGLPGTGKTTAVKALVKLFETTRTSFVLMAPTGIASKRLSNVTGYPASTIHRALGYDGVRWAHHQHSKYVVDAVIVDEVSMVDMELLYRLVSSLRDDTMLVLVGDDAQLPSVGPGNVLKDLSACSSIPSVSLTEIFRQAAESAIVSNSHLINRGEYPILGDPKGDSEFKYVRSTDEARILKAIVSMAQALKSRDANFQVLAPKYDGIVGVDALNEALRDALNPPGPPEWKGKFQHFREGDRLMVIKNDYEKGVYNGDVGKLLHITKDTLITRIYGADRETDMSVSFTRAEAAEKLRLAYAITVHKSQGSEFDTIIMPVVNSQGRMLQRNLLYTAVTRARKTVWLLGEESAIRRAVENNKVMSRNTKLGDAVAGVLEESHERGPSTASEERDRV